MTKVSFWYDKVSARRFVILDRDGTINRECHYLSDPDQLELLPGAVQGLRQLSDAGLGLVIATNQSGLARGYLDQSRLEAIHTKLRELLAAGGVALAGIYYCPHHPDEGCRCRKPGAGMVEDAAAQLGFDPREGFVVGDNASDIKMGHRVGAFTILVATGYGSTVRETGAAHPDAFVNNLEEAATCIRGLIGS